MVEQTDQKSAGPIPTVTKAVIPAAGRGTRMMPISRAIPKEMFLVGRKPMIQYVVEEAVQSGLNQLYIVIREGKEIIRQYFDLDAASLSNPSVSELAALLGQCELTFISQEHQLGLGDALAQARDFVGDQSFVMMIPDQLLVGREPATAQLLSRYQPGPTIFSSLLRLPKTERPFFAGAKGVAYETINDHEVATSRLLAEEETRKIHADLDYEVRGFGRTIFPPEIFDYLGLEFMNPQTGEIDLLRTFESCARDLRIRGVWLEGEPFDLGTFQGYYRYLPRLWELHENFELPRGA